LEEEIAALRRVVRSLRNAIYDLRLEKDQPFVRAVESLVELNRQLTPEREIRLTVRDGFPPQLPSVTDVELLRVLQEALVNARRHSDARCVDVVLCGVTARFAPRSPTTGWASIRRRSGEAWGSPGCASAPPRSGAGWR
jgi:signal transduction histidine kinase